MQPAGNFELVPAVATEENSTNRFPVSQGVYNPAADASRNVLVQNLEPTPAPVNDPPAEPAPESPGVQLYRQGMESLAGQDREAALKAAYKTALCSPDFLFLREAPGPLDPWALASRLSYFLWNSAPDEALLLWDGELHLWSFGGYRGRQLQVRNGEVTLLTPPSFAGAFAAGYRPSVHESAGEH